MKKRFHRTAISFCSLIAVLFLFGCAAVKVTSGVDADGMHVCMISGSVFEGGLLDGSTPSKPDSSYVLEFHSSHCDVVVGNEIIGE